jgi:ABC-2 type transport system permease protein
MTQTVRAGMPRTPAPYLRARAAIAAEWIKLRSLRSFLVTLAATAVFCIAQACLVCSNYAATWPKLDAARRAGFDPLGINLQFAQIGVVFFGVLGAMVVTSEYGNGLIRITFAATPQRGLVLAAKTALFGVVALLCSAAICLTALLAGQGILSGRAPSVGLGDPGVPGHLLGAICYLTAGGLMGVFIGALSRSTAIAISSVFGLFLVLPILLQGVPKDAAWRHTVPYLPSNAGNALWYPHAPHTATLITPATAALALVAGLAVLGAAAVVSLRGRDA